MAMLERTYTWPLLDRSSMNGYDSYEEDANPMVQRSLTSGGRFLKSISIMKEREETLVRGSNVERAAVIVDQAVDGEAIPLEVLREDRCGVAVRAFFLHYKLRSLWFVALTGLVLLLFFEVPPWCKFEGGNPCGDPVIYPRGHLPEISRFAVAVLQGLCVVILSMKHWLSVEFYGVHKVTHDFVQISKVVLLVALVLNSASLLLFPLSRQIAAIYYIRIATVIMFSRTLRGTFMGLVHMTGKFIDILVLVLVYVLISSWFAVLLFHKTPEGQTYFPKYVSTLYAMVLLLTGANLPDIEIPAYRESPLSCIFFVIYLVVGFFILLNILFAVIFDSYKHQVALTMLQEADLRREDLEIAFKLLDEEGRGWIDNAKVFDLLLALNKYRNVPCVQRGKKHYLETLGRHQNFEMEKEEFMELCSLIGLKYTRLDEEHFLETWFPNLYHSACVQAIVKFVNRWHFSACVSTMLIANGAVLLVEGRYYVADDARQGFWFKLLIVFGLLYVVEMVLKLFGRGWTRYWMGYLSRVDFIITWCIVAVIVAQAVQGPFTGINLYWIRYLEILRVSRLVSVLGYFERYKIIIRTFISLTPTLVPLTGVLFFVLLIFCAIGIQAFGGLIYMGNPDLKDTVYLTRNYTVMNFNDFASGMTLVFDLCLMSNWVGYMETFVKVTGSGWSRLFFFGFYVVVVMFMLNLVVAFVLQAFLTQMKHEEAERRTRKELLAAMAPTDRTREVDGTSLIPRLHLSGSRTSLQMLEDIFSSELEQARMNCSVLSESCSRMAAKSNEDGSMNSSATTPLSRSSSRMATKSNEDGSIGRREGQTEGPFGDVRVAAKWAKSPLGEAISSAASQRAVLRQ